MTHTKITTNIIKYSAVGIESNNINFVRNLFEKIWRGVSEPKKLIEAYRKKRFTGNNYAKANKITAHKQVLL